ncbi:hypothetical protein STIAU_5738 [Stigmatella aurantiaca DW4/3-1]|nr:hypothetical protein STIAU_5738 [Stigmatella aurantiaca DW4/3-1]
MAASERAPVLSCTAIKVGASSSSQRSQSLQEGPGTGGSAPVECVPSQSEGNTTVGQSSLGSEDSASTKAPNTTEGVGGAGNTEVKDDPAPMQPGHDSIGSAFQQDSAIVPPEERTQRDVVAPADIVPEQEGVGGAGNTDVGTSAAPAQSGQDALGKPAQKDAEPVAPELDTQSDPMPADTHFQDTGMGGAGGGGG